MVFFWLVPYQALVPDQHQVLEHVQVKEQVQVEEQVQVPVLVPAIRYKNRCRRIFLSLYQVQEQVQVPVLVQSAIRYTNRCRYLFLFSLSSGTRTGAGTCSCLACHQVQ